MFIDKLYGMKCVVDYNNEIKKLMLYRHDLKKEDIEKQIDNYTNTTKLTHLQVAKNLVVIASEGRSMPWEK